MYPWPNFSKIHRDRTTEIRYTSDQFIELYDVDEADLYMIMCKLKSGKRLDVFENDRYGKYILATIYKVMYNRPCYWKKSIERKQEIAEYAVLYALETLSRTSILTIQRRPAASFGVSLCAAVRCPADLS
jgi:hypothetical protein